MEILKKEILPLFELTQKSRQPTTTNQLIQTNLNEYSLYVTLDDIYHRRVQTHEILSHDQRKLKYTLPLHYHEIVLRGKGTYYQDVIINIYSLRDPNFVRINISDLFVYRKLTKEHWDQKTYSFEHLSGEELTVDLDPHKYMKFIKIPNQGLPVPRSENIYGNLYLWLVRADDIHPDSSLTEERHETKYDLNLLMEILNYHPNSNVNLSKSN